MKRWIAALCMASLAAGCASYGGWGLVPGRSRASDVESIMGPPAEKIALADGASEWFYPRQPFGRQMYAVVLGPDGVVRSVEQRLTYESLQKLIIGTTTMREARALLGPPLRTTHLSRQQREVWEYTTYSIAQQEFVLYLQFSSDEVLREVLHLRDLYFDPGGTKD